MTTLTHHHKSVRTLAIHPTEFSFASGSAGGNNIKKWACPNGTFVHNFSGHDSIINTVNVNPDGVFFSGGKLLLLIPSTAASFLRALTDNFTDSPSPSASPMLYPNSRQWIDNLVGLQNWTSFPNYDRHTPTWITRRRSRNLLFYFRSNR